MPPTVYSYISEKSPGDTGAYLSDDRKQKIPVIG